MKKWVFGILIGLIAVGAAVWFLSKRNGVPAPAYGQEKAVVGDVEVKILSTGVVQPENRLEIKAPIAGRVEEVRVEEGQKIKKGQTLAVMSSTERAALLDAAQAQGPDELKRWQQFYQAAPILAPINGTIILRNVEPGQTVTSSDALLVMSNRLTVKAQVDETDIAQVRLKQKARIVLDAYADKAIDAHVEQIAYDATTVNSVTTYIVDVLPENTPPFMRSGMTANVTFYVASKNNVLLIPTSSVKTKGGSSYVLVASLRKQEKPAEKEVKIGLTDGKRVEVLSGLSAGETVLVPQLKTEESGGGAKGSNPFTPFAPRRGR